MNKGIEKRFAELKPTNSSKSKHHPRIENEEADPKNLVTPSALTSDLASQIELAINPKFPNLDIITNIIKIFHHQNPKASPPRPPIKYPVFQGGGAKGGAYIGAYEALDELGYLDEIVCPGGASAGAIPAFFMGLGFDSKQFKYLSESINFKDFTDLKQSGWGQFFSGNKVGVALDMVRYGAASPGKSFHQWASYFVEQVLGDKTATFRDLHDKRAIDPTLKDMLFTGTRYGTKGGIHAQHIFSFETTPDVVIADAFRATIGFPTAFEPWEVRQKEYLYETNLEGKPLKDELDQFKPLRDKDGKPQFTFKSLGFFADGGILNNFPVSSYNKKYYVDPKYPFIERKDQHENPVQVNPCVLGFSLTALEDLDETITPLPESIKQLQTKKITKKMGATSETETPSWHYIDLAKAGFWNVLGKPETESVADKQRVYFDQTVQIWPEHVSTLEFDVSKEKLAHIITNGRNATELWLQKFRSPDDVYPYKKSYDARLSSKEEKLKERKPEYFYYLKLKSLYSEFIAEAKKQQKQGASNQHLLKNIRMLYLSNQIEKFDLHAQNCHIDITRKAFVDACQESAQQRLQVEENRQSRWNIILPEKILKNILLALNQEPENALQMLQSQLGGIIPLVQLNQGALLNAIVMKNDVKLVEKTLQCLLNALNQTYYQGKISDPKMVLAEILNSTNPSLLTNAIENNNLPMIKILMKHGTDVLRINPITGRNALSEAINLSNYAAFKKIFFNCLDEETPLCEFKIGKEKALLYILKTAPSTFLSQLYEDKKFFIAMMNDQIDEKGRNVLHYLAEKGTASAFCDVTYAALASTSFAKSFLTNKDFNDKSPLACLLEHQRLDILKAMIYQGKGKNSGFFLKGDYHFDQIFNWKQPHHAQISDYQDLVQAYIHHPNAYRFIMDNLSDCSKSERMHEIVKRNADFVQLEQPKGEIADLNSIMSEPVLFRKILEKETDKTINQENAPKEKTSNAFRLAA
ncbi:MAG: hypothetical protein BGO43_00490 [Gammaproteobacteria bacterium 39-13]|nr:patatin-like phospholipase family protein [Gammaproteobacteria bacterium]OJV96736.1 MAG: hypothetical protein BGO43_00490 [Gammaproteobacteria bacterium 39-13]